MYAEWEKTICSQRAIARDKGGYDEKKKQGTYVRYPQRSELNADINEALIVEYYSRV